ncbi:MAG: hypothetical protein KKA16_01345 [Alphaproteobacteria bacterium]|nr:hypothetical protein [Alphaproteobacteria bacterium]MBU2379524.1 hypothetical protein [Alphaproteobacteria bacterium]
MATLAVVGLGFWGWRLAGVVDTADAVYRALQAFVLGDVQRDLAEVGAPARALLEAARWLGAFLAFYAVILLLWSSLEAWRIGRDARGRRRHLVVAGGDPFADRLSEAAAGDELRLGVVQLRDPDQRPATNDRLIRLPFHGFDHDGLDEAGTARARRLVVALSDDGAAVDLALSAQRRYPTLSILARLRDSGLSKNLHDLPGGETLRAFSEAEAAAREIVRRHPPFLLAEDRRQQRIHALLIGDEDWVEAILTELILSSRTLKLDKPRLTLAVVDATALQQRLSVRYPELEREADLAFSALDLPMLTPSESARPDGDTITAVYCAFDEGARSLTAALALKRQARSWAGFGAPILVRVSGDQGLERPRAGADLRALDIIPFGSMTDVIHAAGIISETSDRAEREWHEAYLRLNPNSNAAVSWGRLSEEYRLSNRRAVAHAYAKLHEAGFDLRPWLATAKPWDELPALATGEALFRDEAELMRLAELEHERWNADRRLLGWRFGEVKDNGRKHHPCLVDFANLPPEIQGYDIELIRSLDQILPRKKGGLKRCIQVNDAQSKEPQATSAQT